MGLLGVLFFLRGGIKEFGVLDGGVYLLKDDVAVDSGVAKDWVDGAEFIMRLVVVIEDGIVLR